MICMLNMNQFPEDLVSGKERGTFPGKWESPTVWKHFPRKKDLGPDFQYAMCPDNEPERYNCSDKQYGIRMIQRLPGLHLQPGLWPHSKHPVFGKDIGGYMFGHGEFFNQSTRVPSGCTKRQLHWPSLNEKMQRSLYGTNYE